MKSFRINWIIIYSDNSRSSDINKIHKLKELHDLVSYNLKLINVLVYVIISNSVIINISFIIFMKTQSHICWYLYGKKEVVKGIWIRFCIHMLQASSNKIKICTLN